MNTLTQTHQSVFYDCATRLGHLDQYEIWFDGFVVSKPWRLRGAGTSGAIKFPGNFTTIKSAESLLASVYPLVMRVGC